MSQQQAHWQNLTMVWIIADRGHSAHQKSNQLLEQIANFRRYWKKDEFGKKISEIYSCKKLKLHDIIITTSLCLLAITQLEHFANNLLYNRSSSRKIHSIIIIAMTHQFIIIEMSLSLIFAHFIMNCTCSVRSWQDRLILCCASKELKADVNLTVMGDGTSTCQPCFNTSFHKYLCPITHMIM